MKASFAYRGYIAEMTLFSLRRPAFAANLSLLPLFPLALTLALTLSWARCAHPFLFVEVAYDLDRGTQTVDADLDGSEADEAGDPDACLPSGHGTVPPLTTARANWPRARIRLPLDSLFPPETPPPILA